MATSIVSVFTLDRTVCFTIQSQHWHGIIQHKSNAFDGAAFVTQCPIVPDDTFKYKFDVPDQAVRPKYTL